MNCLLTHGGLPETESYIWEKTTYQRLGKIVGDLMDGVPKKMIEAYKDFYEMKRHFLAPVFDVELIRLDTLRITRKAERMPTLLERARGYLLGGVPDNAASAGLEFGADESPEEFTVSVLVAGSMPVPEVETVPAAVIIPPEPANKKTAASPLRPFTGTQLSLF